MTTSAFSRLAGPTAQAMNTAYQKAQQGQPAGTFPCPKCGSRITFQFVIGGKTSGRCAAAQCVRWSQ